MFLKGGSPMDQIKTGYLIADQRRKCGMTQRQLTDSLGISDKTISKWECGNGLPEVSLMLPLCDVLGITVNDLLSGQMVSQGDYQQRAEENMLYLMKENQENKTNWRLSVIFGVLSIIAVLSLIINAALLNLPVWVRILLVLLAFAAAATGVGAATVLQSKAGYFECPYCRELFVPDMKDFVKAYHTFTKRRLTCPGCGKTGMCRHRVAR
jgi:transcriptional regulator with XRE-family HTH domain